MKLECLSSSSKGNCYLIGNDSETLIIEAGVSIKKIKKALNFDFRSVQGAIITHEHGDHAKSAKDLYHNFGVKVYASKGTFEALSIKIIDRYTNQLTAKKAVKIGNFKVLPFDVKHDAKEPLGFLIEHPEMGKLVFITDSYYVPYVFKGLNHILIEANYSEKILNRNIENGNIPGITRRRTLKSHMEIENTKDFLKSNNLTNVNNIVLLHLSNGNSDGNLFKKEVSELTGKNTYIADEELEIELNKEPY